MILSYNIYRYKINIFLSFIIQFSQIIKYTILYLIFSMDWKWVVFLEYADIFIIIYELWLLYLYSSKVIFVSLLSYGIIFLSMQIFLIVQLLFLLPIRGICNETIEAFLLEFRVKCIRSTIRPLFLGSNSRWIHFQGCSRAMEACIRV